MSRQRYVIIHPLGSKLPSKTVSLWINDTSPTVSRRTLTTKYISQKRQKLNIDAALQTSALGLAGNGKWNQSFREVMNFNPKRKTPMGKRTAAGVQESPGVGRSGDNDDPSFDGTGSGTKSKKTRGSLGSEEEADGQYGGNGGFGNDGFGDFGNDDFGNDDFGNDPLVGEGNGGGGARVSGNGNDRTGVSNGLAPSNNQEATNESELMLNLTKAGMTQDFCVDFHEVVFGKGAVVVEGDEKKDDDDDDDDDEAKEMQSLPTRSVAARSFFALLLAANNFKVVPQQDEAWGRIQVRAAAVF